jgi:hypothetical protein
VIPWPSWAALQFWLAVALLAGAVRVGLEVVMDLGIAWMSQAQAEGWLAIAVLSFAAWSLWSWRK